MRGRASPHRRVCWQAPTRFEQVTYDRSWAKSKIPSIKRPALGALASVYRTTRFASSSCRSARASQSIPRRCVKSFAKLERGVAVADSEVANALCNNAVHSNNVAAQIWRSKAGMRWSETLGRCPLTIRRQIDILQSGPGWEGTEYNSINSDGARSSRCSAARRLRGRSDYRRDAGSAAGHLLTDGHQSATPALRGCGCASATQRSTQRS